MNLKKSVTTAALVTLLGLGSSFSGEKMVGLEERVQMYPDSTIIINQDSTNKIKENYKVKTSLENQLTEAYNSVYQIRNVSYYSTADGNPVRMWGVSGSGILLEDGYFLTAAHVVDVDFPESVEGVKFHTNGVDIGGKDYGLGEVIVPAKRDYSGMKYHHNQLTIVDHDSREVSYEVEEVILSENYDYALLKLKGTDRFREWIDLSYYKKGFNLPDTVHLGMESVAMGYSLGIHQKTLRMGNISEIEGKLCGKEYFGIKNDILPGDSGGPIFVIEDGEVKLAAIASAMYMMRDFFASHPTNIGCALSGYVILDEINEIKKDLLKEKKNEMKKIMEDMDGLKNIGEIQGK